MLVYSEIFVFWNFVFWKYFVLVEKSLGIYWNILIARVPFCLATANIMTWNPARCTDAKLCDKVCQWLATGRWFSPGTPVSSTNKTDRHDITETLLKVALSMIKQKPTNFCFGLLEIVLELFVFLCRFTPCPHEYSVAV